MNLFNIDGKVVYINKNSDDEWQGVTINHYPASISDSYVEMGIVFPKELFSKCQVQLYDYIEVKGHYVTVNKLINPKKTKLVHIVDEVVSLEHEIV